MTLAVYRDKVTPTRILIPANGIETKDPAGSWAAQCIEVSISAGGERLICRSTFIPYQTLENQYKKEEL